MALYITFHVPCRQPATHPLATHLPLPTTCQRFVFAMLLSFQIAVQAVILRLNSVLVSRWPANSSPSAHLKQVRGVNTDRKRDHDLLGSSRYTYHTKRGTGSTGTSPSRHQEQPTNTPDTPLDVSALFQLFEVDSSASPIRSKK